MSFTLFLNCWGFLFASFIIESFPSYHENFRITEMTHTHTHICTELYIQNLYTLKKDEKYFLCTQECCISIQALMKIHHFHVFREYSLFLFSACYKNSIVTHSFDSMISVYITDTSTPLFPHTRIHSIQSSFEI